MPLKAQLRTPIRIWALGMVLSFAGNAQEKAPDPLMGAPTFEQVTNQWAQPYLDQRHAAIAAIDTEAKAKARQAQVRSILLRLLGSLPNDHSPLNAKAVGTLDEDGFRIEKLIYDSRSGYHVTANLYLPPGKGPFPAIIYHAGHAPFGKAEAFSLASNLARNGIAVLAYDPLGAGERLQAINPETGKSWAGPDEHSQAQIPISPIGGHVARYMIWDAMRGIDYLTSRPDIDPGRIGSYGCSGGGTLSAYLTALDTRVKAGVVACYLTTYEELLKGIGPQDGEQVMPGFLKDGLDLPDLIEAAAPRAYAMVSTTEDMFPFAGAQAAHDEALRYYDLLGARDNLQWFTGPGHHGAIRPLMPQIAEFYRHWLLASDHPPMEMAALKSPPLHDLECTSTGQVTTALKGRTIYEINQERARAILPAKAQVRTHADLAQLQSRLKHEIPLVTGMQTGSGPTAKVTVTKTEQRSAYRLETLVFPSRSGMNLPAMLAIPEKPGRSPALLMSGDSPLDHDLDQAAKAGQVVLAMTPVPWPPSGDKPRPTMGTMLPWTSRAFLVGKTVVGMRTEDVLAAVEWLSKQPQVDAARISAYGEGASGVVLLHAAVLEPHIRRITIEHTLSTYASVVNVPVHRHVAESVIPGVLLDYDLDDLMIAVAPRKISVVNPVDGAGAALDEAAFRAQLARVYAADSSLNLKNRVVSPTRAPGEVLPGL